MHSVLRLLVAPHPLHMCREMKCWWEPRPALLRVLRGSHMALVTRLLCKSLPFIWAHLKQIELMPVRTNSVEWFSTNTNTLGSGQLPAWMQLMHWGLCQCSKTMVIVMGSTWKDMGLWASAIVISEPCSPSYFSWPWAMSSHSVYVYQPSSTSLGS